MTLLSVEDLHTHFVARDLDNEVRTARALNGVTFALEAGRALGIVGETGAGKSLTAHSVMGLLRPPARIVKGRIVLEGRELTRLAAGELNALRGDRMALVVQSPRAALDPLSPVGDQLIRVQKRHRRIGTLAARAYAIATLSAVGIADATRRMRAFPHELSGGMAQRVLIALALINEPRLLIADEPTTGLDVTVQAQILDLIGTLRRERGIGLLLISHDLGVVAHACDEMAVMFAGRIVEHGPVARVFAAPAHPYTRALIAASPERLRLGETRFAATAPPDLYALPAGCTYRDRCPLAAPACGSAPPLVALAPGHGALCFFAGAKP